MGVKENSNTQDCLNFLRLKQILCWRAQSFQGWLSAYKGARPSYVRAGMPGLSDIVAVLPSGKALFLEIKIKGRKENENQKIFEAKVNKMTSAYYAIVYEVVELVQILEDLKHEMVYA